MSIKKLFNVRYLLLFSILFSIGVMYAEKTEIIDTLYAVDAMQGTIGYHIEINQYMGGVCPPSEGLLYVGDTYDVFTQCNVSIRSYISFPIESVPENYHIETATLLLYQRFSTGNGGNFIFPIWYNGLYYPCLAANVDYDNTLELSDFNTPVLSDIGIVSENNTYGWKSLDITTAYINDVSAGNQYCQLLLYFRILSDYDCNDDWLSFDNAHTPYIGNNPKIIVHYHSNTGVNENTITLSQIHLFPNPVETRLNLKLSEGTKLNKIEIYNIKGKVISVEKMHQTSNHEFALDFSKSKLKSGLYLFKCSYSYRGKKCTELKKIMLL